MIENIIVQNGNVLDSDQHVLFADEPVHFTQCTTIDALCKELGIFPSTTQARKAGRFGDIPQGFTFEYKASKTRRLWIWNPA